MSKQRYLLGLILLCFAFLRAEIQFQSGFFNVSDEGHDNYLAQNRLDANIDVTQHLNLLLSTKLDATSKKLGDFPQEQWLSNQIALGYKRTHWGMESSYRNLKYGNVERLQLYPSWSLNKEFDRKEQHQMQLVVNGKLWGFALSGYGMNKQLSTNHIDYIWDNNVFDFVPTLMPNGTMIDEYYGASVSYQATPYLNINASTDLKQDNYTETGIYDQTSYTLGSEIELKPISSGRFTGSFLWQNSSGVSLADITTNIYQTSLRYQQSLGMQLNGFVSLINNGCSDDKLSEIYLLSNQVRCHLQYYFPYDPAQASYINAGFKHSLDRKAIAYFGEGQWLILPHIYGTIGFRNVGETLNHYNAKLSYSIAPLTECYLQYMISDSELLSKPQNYIGIGTSIQL